MAARESFDISIVDLSGATYPVHVAKDESIRSVVSKAATSAGVGDSTLRLIYGGKSLDETKTINEAKIIAGSTLHMVYRVRGGF
ncbi:hypothetical protein HK101_008596 [Irineochytrium annulatum]|nr:hypothetical protein HK101_008596 [Irineochytrium annulatum]